MKVNYDEEILNKKRYRVIEIFKSIDGEGPYQGQLAVFIRFYKCNLNCTWCDTTYSNDKDYTEESINDLYQYILDSEYKNITITGGEPLIQEDLNYLVGFLTLKGFNISIETNGSINIDSIKKFVKLNGDINNLTIIMDYKLPESNMESKMDLSNFKSLDTKDYVKFVISSNKDLDRFYAIFKQYNLNDITNTILSPVFDRIDLIEIVDFMKLKIINGVKLQVQMHKIIWDKDKRGV